MISPPGMLSTIRALPFTITLKIPQDNSLLCERLLRDLPGKRQVYEGKWQQRPVLVKLFLDSRNARRHWAREKAGVEALINTGVPTPELLFAGYLDDDTHVLIFDFLPDAQTALEVWDNLETPESQLAFLHQLVELFAGLHGAGLTQDDVHLENFLVSEQQVYAIDGDAITAQGNKPLDLNSSSSNLVLLFAQLIPKYDFLMDSAALHYAKLRNISGPQLLIRLKMDLPKARTKRRHKYVDKCYRSCSEFVYSKRAGQTAVSRRDVQGEVLNRLLNDPEAFIRNGELLKDGNTSTVLRVQDVGCDWVIKRYNIKSPSHALSRCFRPTRAWTSWGNAHRLKISGIATPRALAMIEKRIGPLRSTGYYVCDFVAGVHAEDFFLNDTVDAITKEQVAEKFICLFALFHKLNIYHGDCKATNFLLKDNEPWVLDLDAMHECSSPAYFKKLFLVDRQRFLRNWQADPELQKWFDDHLPESCKHV